MQEICHKRFQSRNQNTASDTDSTRFSIFSLSAFFLYTIKCFSLHFFCTIKEYANFMPKDPKVKKSFPIPFGGTQKTLFISNLSFMLTST